MKLLIFCCRIFLTVNFLPGFIGAQNFTSFMTGNPDDMVVDVNPAFVLAGGGSDHDEAMRWMLSRAAGGDVLVLRASGSNGYNHYFYSELGVSVHSVETIVFSNKQASSEPYVLQQIKNAEIIFIAGGDQTKYYDYWAGTETGELLKSICKNRSKVIGGTSAGMMILGNLVYTPVNSGVTSDEALGNPYHANLNYIVYNTFIQTPVFENTIFDTHFENRNREGRLVVFLAKAAFEKDIRAKAIACNESTVVCVDENNIATIFGNTPQFADHAFFMEVNCEQKWKPSSISENSKLHWTSDNENMIIVQKIKGTKQGTNKFDLNQWKALNDSDNEYWHVLNGTVKKKPTSNTNCSVETSSIKDFNEKAAIIFPNPTCCVVNFPESELTELFSFEGIKLFSQKNVHQFDVSFYKAGKYHLILTKDGVKLSYLVVKF